MMQWEAKRCMLKTMSLPRSDVFWSRVEKTESCWLWRGATANRRQNKPVYGTFGAGGRYYYTHRYAYELQHGPIPEGMCVCHKCDVPLCVRGDHLFAGTKKDNVRDMNEKGRAARGERVTLSRLSALDVPVIRQMKGRLSAKKVAAKYKVSSGTINAIWYGRTWRHVA